MADIDNKIRYTVVMKGGKTYIKNVSKFNTVTKKWIKLNKETSKSLEGVIKKTLFATRNTRNLGKQTSKLAGTFSVLRSKLLLASFAVTIFAKTIGIVVNATRKQEDAEKKLMAAIKSTGNATGISSKTMMNFASNLQAVTKFGDETIIGAEALMLTFTKIGREAFPEAIKASLNLSEAMGQDLQQTVLQVGKALNDPIQGMSALRRVGIQLSKEQQNQIKNFVYMNDVASAQNIILQELEAQFGGMAEAAAQTTSGALIQLKNAWGDLLEKIGEDITPVLNAFVKSLGNLTMLMMSEREKEIIILQKLGFSEELINERRKIMFEETMKGLQEEGVARLSNWGTVQQGLTSLMAMGKSYGDLNDKIKMNKKLMEGDEETLNALAKSMKLTRADVEIMIENMMASNTAFKSWGDLLESVSTMLSRPIESIVSLGETIEATSDKGFIAAVGHREQGEALVEQHQKLRDFMLTLRAYLELLGHQFPEVQAEAIDLTIKLTKVTGIAMNALADALDPATTGGEVFKKFIINIIDAMKGVILASAAMSQALKWAWTPQGAIASIAALIALEVAKAKVQSIKFAARGMDEIVTRPTLIVAGEAGAERVNIAPLGAGSSAASNISRVINVNIYGGIVQEDYVRNELLPAINKAKALA